MTINLFTSEDRYLPWITTVPVFTLPTTLGIAHARVTLARHRLPNRRSRCRIIATQQLDSLTVPWTPYVFNNCILVFTSSPTCLLVQHNCDRFNGHERLFFSQHRPPTIRHFFPLGSCDCRWLRNDVSIPCAPENMSHKISLQFISTFGHDIPLPF